VVRNSSVSFNEVTLSEGPLPDALAVEVLLEFGSSFFAMCDEDWYLGAGAIAGWWPAACWTLPPCVAIREGPIC